MGRADYEAAATSAGRQLETAPPAASWDPDLAPAIVAHGRAVHEEQLLDELVVELARDRSVASR
jgi:hypothetical protein